MVMVEPIPWTVTPWIMNGHCGWQQQPVILVNGQIPFYADHPPAYIEKLREMHDDPLIARGSFFTCIGQFQDGLEQAWDICEQR